MATMNGVVIESQSEEVGNKYCIVVFNKVFFKVSETFIYRQILALSENFHVELLGYRLDNCSYFDFRSLRFSKLEMRGYFIERGILYLLRKTFNFRSSFTLSNYVYFFRYFKLKRAIVHAHFGGNGVFLWPYLKKLNIPLIVSFHGRDASRQLEDTSYKTKLPQLFAYASHIIVCSDHMIKSLDLKIYEKKVSVIPYGVDVDEFKPVHISESTLDLKILHSGRIVEKKGVLDLIRVFSGLKEKYPQITLQIVGEGDMLPECKRLVIELGLQSHVFFFGAQPLSKVKELMNACDIFVLNSRTAKDGDMEGVPNSILEAMAFEKPVVSTNHAGIPMVIENGISGLLVDEYDHKGLKDAIEKLICDTSLRSFLGKNARYRVIEKFSSRVMAESLKSVFDGAIEAHKRKFAIS